MNPSKIFFTFILLITSLHFSYSQQIGERKEILYNDSIYYQLLTQEDWGFDPGHEAIYLQDKTIVHYVNLSKSVCAKDIMIKILNSDGLDYGNLYFPKNKNGSLRYDKVALKIINLENDQVVVRRITQSEIENELNKDKDNENKFITPFVKEGTIIQYQYETVVPSFSVGWYYQKSIPVLESSFGMVPSKGFFVQKQFGTKKIMNDKVLKSGAFLGFVSLDADSIEAYFEDEAFSISKESYTEHCKVKLKMITNWVKDNEYVDLDVQNDLLIETGLFGKNLQRKKGILKSIDQGKKKNDFDSTISYIKFLKESFQEFYSWDEEYYPFPIQEVGNTKKDKIGMSGDLNYLFIMALREAGIYSMPLLCSTRDHVQIEESFPIPFDANHLICYVIIDDKKYFIDVTDDKMPFGFVNNLNLNKGGYIIDETHGGYVNLENDFKYEEIHSIKINIKDDKAKGEIKSRRKEHAAILSLKEERGADEIINRDSLEKEAEKNIANDWAITKIEGTLSGEENEFVDVKGIIEKEVDMDDFIYLEPIAIPPYSENPFKAEERHSPIDLRCPVVYKYAITIHIPEGYRVEEVPEDLILNLPNQGGRFIYGVTESTDNIQLNIYLKIDQVYYEVLEYPSIREFFTLFLDKINELVVLVKED